MDAIEYIKEKLSSTTGIFFLAWILGTILFLVGAKTNDRIALGLGNMLIGMALAIAFLDLVDYLIRDYRRWKREKQTKNR